MNNDSGTNRSKVLVDLTAEIVHGITGTETGLTASQQNEVEAMLDTCEQENEILEIMATCEAAPAIMQSQSGRNYEGAAREPVFTLPAK